MGRHKPRAVTAGYDDVMSARYESDFQGIFGGRDRGDLAFFIALARSTPGPICEVGAGTGRVLLAVAEAVPGRGVVGVEPSAAMRAQLEARLVEGAYPRVRARVGSFQALPLKTASQGLVFAAFRSFQHLLTPADQLAGLAEMRRVLRPGGVMALDFFDPGPYHVRRSRALLGARYATARGFLERWESREVDRVAQRVDITFRWIEKSAEGVVLRDDSARYAVRYTFASELEHLVARAGFVAIDVRADYAGRPLGPRPRELVLTCRKPEAQVNQVKRSGAKALR